MKSRLGFALPAIMLVIASVFYLALSHSENSFAAKKLVFVPSDTVKRGPVIKVDEDVFDFKNIEQGTFAEHKFIIHNEGSDTLVIIGTHPSCGCTAAIMDNAKIAPGTSSRLDVKFDANGKGEGPITKTVTINSNAINKPDYVIRIEGIIVKSKTAHKQMMHLDGVFAGDCAKCHVDKGRGELGARLYEADCAICHGAKADGKPGPELASKEMMEHSPSQLRKIIENGVPHSNMPAFATRNKGPLGKDEIASLVEYVGAFKKNLERTNKMKDKSELVR